MPGRRSARSSTTRTGDRPAMPGRRQVKQRIVREDRADPDQDGVALRAEQVHPGSGGFAGNRHRLAAGGADPIVAGYRELEDQMRTLFADAPEMTGVIVRGLGRANADIDGMPAARSRAWPCPATSGSGSSIADTTRATPAAISASAQGGVLPTWVHGSSVT